jgi:ubiquinol-cytochrome c reductase cytochrome c subunit
METDVRITHIVSSLVAAAIVVTLSSATGHAAQAAQPPAAAAAAAPQGDAEKGKKIFNTVGCYECHGREGQGSAYTGPRLGPNPLPWPALSKYVRSPKGEMPPYKPQVLPDSDLADIYAFLRSRPRPVPVDAFLDQ